MPLSGFCLCLSLSARRQHDIGSEKHDSGIRRSAIIRAAVEPAGSQLVPRPVAVRRWPRADASACRRTDARQRPQQDRSGTHHRTRQGHTLGWPGRRSRRPSRRRPRSPGCSEGRGSLAPASRRHRADWRPLCVADGMALHPGVSITRAGAPDNAELG